MLVKFLPPKTVKMILNYVLTCASCRLIDTIGYKSCNCLVVDTLKPKVISIDVIHLLFSKM